MGLLNQAAAEDADAGHQRHRNQRQPGPDRESAAKPVQHPADQGRGLRVLVDVYGIRHENS
jgi:hypothetical protein